MLLLQWIVPLLMGSVALTALARRIAVPYPAFLALGGIVLAVLPQGPDFRLDPNLALALFVAPVLLDTAYDISLRDLRAVWLPIAAMAIAAVLVTTAAVAVAARAMRPDLPWAAAIALGAIVAPPDATAATAILRQVRPPMRVRMILEGESLLNDASALFIYRLAVGAVAAGTFSGGSLVAAFVLVLPASIAAGWAVSLVTTRIVGMIEDMPSSIIIQFTTTLAIWMVAEHLQLSAVITIVSYAVAISRRPQRRFGARLRLPAFAIWEAVTFMLNVLAFVLIGLQLRPILEAMPPDKLVSSLGFAAVVLGVCVVVRLGWTMGYQFVRLRPGARLRRAQAEGMPTGAINYLKGGFIVGWSGMRGIVTLAAAFALPDGRFGEPSFPYRDLILLTAFVVVFGTLVVQGLSLGPILRRIGLEDGEDVIGREIGRTRTEINRAALAEIVSEEGAAADVLREEYRRILRHAEEHPDGFAPARTEQDALRLRTIAAARRRLFELREIGEIGNDAFQVIEFELDRAEMHATEV